MYSQIKSAAWTFGPAFIFGFLFFGKTAVNVSTNEADVCCGEKVCPVKIGALNKGPDSACHCPSHAAVFLTLDCFQTLCHKMQPNMGGLLRPCQCHNTEM